MKIVFNIDLRQGKQLLKAAIFWLLGGGTDVFYSKKQPSKAQYKKKVVLRSFKTIRTNDYQSCRNKNAVEGSFSFTKDYFPSQSSSFGN